MILGIVDINFCLDKTRATYHIIDGGGTQCSELNYQGEVFEVRTSRYFER